MNYYKLKYCRPVLAAQECAASVMSSSICQFPDTQNPMILVAQRQFAAVNTAVDFVCRDNVDGMYFRLYYWLATPYS